MNPSNRVEPSLHSNNAGRFLAQLNEIHQDRGMSYREVGLKIDIDHTYIKRILAGERRPGRDILIVLLVFAYGCDQLTVDEILQSAGYLPLSHRLRLEQRQMDRGPQANVAQGMLPEAV